MGRIKRFAGDRRSLQIKKNTEQKNDIVLNGHLKNPNLGRGLIKVKGVMFFSYGAIKDPS